MQRAGRLILLLSILVFAQDALAYVGPGLGAGVIGVILGLVVSVFVALIAVFWYPIKRLFKRGKRDKRGKPDQTKAADEET